MITARTALAPLLALLATAGVSQVVKARPTRAPAPPADAVRVTCLTPVTRAAFAPGGDTLAIASYHHRAATLVDSRTGRVARLLQGHGAEVRALAWAPGGRRLATGDLDGEVRVWDARTFQCEVVLPRQEGALYSLVFGPDGRTLASVSYRDELRVHDVETGKVVWSRSDPSDALAFGADWLAVGDRRIGFVAPGDGRAVRRPLELRAHHAASVLLPTADGAWLAVLQHDTRYHSTNELAVFDLRQRGTHGMPQRGDLRADHVAWDGGTVVTAFEREVTGRDGRTGAVLFQRTVAPEGTKIVALTPRGGRYCAARQVHERRGTVWIGPAALSVR